MTEEVTLESIQHENEQLKAGVAQLQVQIERQEALLRELHAVAKTGSIRNGAWQYTKERLLNAFK